MLVLALWSSHQIVMLASLKVQWGRLLAFSVPSPSSSSFVLSRFSLSMSLFRILSLSHNRGYLSLFTRHCQWLAPKGIMGRWGKKEGQVLPKCKVPQSYTQLTRFAPSVCMQREGDEGRLGIFILILVSTAEQSTVGREAAKEQSASFPRYRRWSDSCHQQARLLASGAEWSQVRRRLTKQSSPLCRRKEWHCWKTGIGGCSNETTQRRTQMEPNEEMSDEQIERTLGGLLVIPLFCRSVHCLLVVEQGGECKTPSKDESKIIASEIIRKT